MAEVLEIQIHDKGTVGSGAASSPPRPPSLPPEMMWPRGSTSSSAAGAGSPGWSLLPTAAAKPGKSIVDEVLDRLGLGKEVRAFQQLFDYFAGKPAKEKTGPGAPMGASKGPDPDAIHAAIVSGFSSVEKILSPVGSHFADLPEPGPIVAPEQSAANAPVSAPAANVAHVPVSPPLSHRGGEAHPAGHNGPPRPPEPHFLRMPSTAEEHGPPRPPLTPARVPTAGGGAAAGEGAAAAAEAAEGAEALAAGAEVAGAGLASVSAAALPVAAGFVVVGGAIELMHKSIQHFTQRAHELAGFSPDIMQSEATRSVQSMVDDMKEAQQLGPDMARMLDAETSMTHDLREFLLPIKKVIVDILADVLETLAEWLKDGRAILTKEFWAEFIQDIIAAMKPEIMGGISVKEAWEKIIGKMDEIKRKMKEGEPNHGINFLQDLYNFGMFNEVAPALPDQNQHRPNIPLIQFLT